MSLPPAASGSVGSRFRSPVDVLVVYLSALFLVPAPLVFEPLGGAGSPSTLIGLALLVLWALSRFVPDWHPRGFQPMHVIALVLAAAVLVSFTLAMLEYRLPVEVRGADRGLLRLASSLGVLLYTADGIRTRTELHRVVRAVVALAGVIALIGLVQFWTGTDLAAQIRLPGLSTDGVLVNQGRSDFLRIRATASHPIESGAVLAMVLPLALHLALERGRPPRWVIACLAMIGLVALLSVSRSAVVALAVGLVVVFLGWSPRLQLNALLIAPFVLVGVRLAVPGLVGTLRSLFANAGQDPSVSGRTDDYAVLAQYLDGRALTGLGYGTFIPEVYTTFDNQYLLQLVETGVLGLAALVSMYLAGWFCARGARRLSRVPVDRQVAQALAAAVAASAVTAALFDLLSFPMITGLTFLLVGCCGAAWRIARQDPTSEGTPAARVTSSPAETVFARTRP